VQYGKLKVRRTGPKTTAFDYDSEKPATEEMEGLAELFSKLKKSPITVELQPDGGSGTVLGFPEAGGASRKKVIREGPARAPGLVALDLKGFLPQDLSGIFGPALLRKELDKETQLRLGTVPSPVAGGKLKEDQQEDAPPLPHAKSFPAVFKYSGAETQSGIKVLTFALYSRLMYEKPERDMGLKPLGAAAYRESDGALESLSMDRVATPLYSRKVAIARVAF
jgi:hypothetical protein